MLRERHILCPISKSGCCLTPESMCDQQHFAILPSADLFDDVEVLLDLQVTQALSRQLHQLIDQAAVSEAQLNHLNNNRTEQI